MMTNGPERTHVSPTLVWAWCFGLFAAAIAAGACGGTAGKAPSVGSESHFLAHCEATCEGGLDCIGGICTRPCLTDQSSCSDIAQAASCTNQSVEPGQVAVCDVSCAGSGDCQAVGSGFTCEAGYCRQPRSPDSTLGSDAGLCESFRDQILPADVPLISIINSGNQPLYILPDSRYCPAVSSLVRVERDGQAVDVLPPAAPYCENTCQVALDDGWKTGPQRDCPSDCPIPRIRMIQPGQTLQQSANLEAVERNLPNACVAGAPDPAASVRCISRAMPPPGNYTLSVHLTNLDCGPDTDCGCYADATGECNNYNVLLYGVSGSETVVSFPSSSYFQNQELRIAAPVN